ncbi:PREDICTED: anoctamin-9 [Myotis brandtii]|uniref:anoctamin-9 n=1 Tax=Myotis brandtii TaxID=109478 RepID=UPI0007041ED0|nr:PREDICTED: anoctamin-9 [Myotis brandtii]
MDMGAPEPDRLDQTLTDYVLVADYRTQRDPSQVRRQRQFLKELQAKGFQFKAPPSSAGPWERRLAKGTSGMWIRGHGGSPGDAGEEQGEDDEKRHLDEGAGPPRRRGAILCFRIRIVNFILNCRTAAGDTFDDLVKDGVFETRFPLHKGKETLKRTWARWRNMFRKQPVDDIRNYFGEKVALYFAWLGWYTCMLVPAALVGLIVFLSGFSLFNASQISPACDPLLRAATVFLEFWKRQRARVVLDWDLYGWDEDQEEVALELINCPDYKLQLHQHSYLRSTIILILSLLMICLMIGMAHVLVVYRVAAAAVFSSSALPFLEDQVTTAVVVAGALRAPHRSPLCRPQVNKYVALKLCDYEKSRTFSERESKFTVKFFTLQFFAHFSSLVYIAFILGRINGHPGKTVRLAGLGAAEGVRQTREAGRPEPLPVYAQDGGSGERRPGCRPWPRSPRGVWPGGCHGCRSQRWDEAPRLSRLLAWGMDGGGWTVGDGWRWGRQQQWLRLQEPDSLSPLLGPGTWLQVLETIGVLAVIANGMVIAFTSEFIPRVVYKYRYGPCRQGARSSVDCLTGYINHSLSVFHTKDFEDPVKIKGSENITECRYRDYRNAQDYNFSEQFWILLAIRLAFLILFEHVALCIKLVAAWFVPDVPQSVKNRVLEQKYKVLLGKLCGGPRQMWGPGLGLRATPASSSSLRSTDV